MSKGMTKDERRKNQAKHLKERGVVRKGSFNNGPSATQAPGSAAARRAAMKAAQPAKRTAPKAAGRGGRRRFKGSM